MLWDNVELITFGNFLYFNFSGGFDFCVGIVYDVFHVKVHIDTFSVRAELGMSISKSDMFRSSQDGFILLY
jgi:hypothetical protein